MRTVVKEWDSNAAKRGFQFACSLLLLLAKVTAFLEDLDGLLGSGTDHWRKRCREDESRGIAANSIDELLLASDITADNSVSLRKRS